jgi:hypothetical protein
MKIFILFAPKFLEWPLAIMREIRRRRPDAEFIGVVAGKAATFRYLQSRSAGLLSRLDRFTDLERGWLTGDLNDRRLEEYEARLGVGAVRRIITSDRQVGAGLVSGGRVPPTALTKSLRDPDRIRRYVLGQLDYVFQMLERERPDLVFCYGVAGSIAVSLVEASQYLGIRFAGLSATRIGSLRMVDDSPARQLLPAERTFRCALADPQVVAEHLPAARAYIERFRQTPEEPAHASFSRTRQRQQQTVSAIVTLAANGARAAFREVVWPPDPELRYPSAFRRTLFSLRVRLRAGRLTGRGPFTPLGQLPDRDFAYFPLHVDPEATTMVAAPMHTDQLAVIEAIAKSLPMRLNLVVKEHVPMLGLRPPGFYERIGRMPGVILASPFEHGPSLVNRASLICVITGTAGWEALIQGRPVLVIGKAFYDVIGQGVVGCSSLEKLPGAIERARKSEPVDDERLALYVASILKNSFEFPPEALWGKVTPQVVEDYQETLRHLCDRILAEAEAAERFTTDMKRSRYGITGS